MNKTIACLPLVFATASHAAPPPAAPPPAPELAEVQLRGLNHRFVSVFAQEDPGFLEGLTDTDFLLTTASGEWLDRAGQLAQARPVSPKGSVSADDVEVRIFGDVALVHGVFEMVGQEGPARVRYTDVYRWDGANWRLISAQNTPIRAGVAKEAVRGQKPDSVKWQGPDPRGDDLEVLRALNESYVRAFREADVAWYDAHLTDDYVVINGDGSLHDRAQALTEFAKPTFATYLENFPVGQVRIRRFGDIALIHAENDYQRKDGRRGISRYTDIWRKEKDGRWRCLAAHITVHRPPS